MSTPATREGIGTGWRTAAWMAFGLAALLAVQAMNTSSQDFVHAAMVAGGVLLAMLVALLGLVFSVFAISASAPAGDRRPALMFPLLANAALFLFVTGIAFTP